MSQAEGVGGGGCGGEMEWGNVICPYILAEVKSIKVNCIFKSVFEKQQATAAELQPPCLSPGGREEGFSQTDNYSLAPGASAARSCNIVKIHNKKLRTTEQDNPWLISNKSYLLASEAKTNNREIRKMQHICCSESSKYQVSVLDWCWRHLEWGLFSFCSWH